jgi:hypothetical protein
MSSTVIAQKSDIWQRLGHEMKKYVAIVLYLAFFFGSVVNYERLVLAGYHIGYTEFGVAIVKALVLGKVILIGEALHVGERFRGRALWLPVLWKTFVFSLFIAAFVVVEHLVGAAVHHRTLAEEFQFVTQHRDIVLARIQLETVALVPLFAFMELGRVLGERELHSLFLHGPTAAAPGGRG